MPKILKVELNREGVKELLQSKEMQDIVGQYASAKASQAGDGYAYEVNVGQRRAYANVYAKTSDARKDNLTNNTLEKVIRLQ